MADLNEQLDNQNVDPNNQQETKNSKGGLNILEPLYIYFSKAFRFFNEKVFENLLPNVGLLIQEQKPRANLLGFFRRDNFVVDNNNVPIITLIVDAITETNVIENFETLIHEMVHFEAFVKGINDCSRSQFHNKHFKELAENRGYVIEIKDKRRGYSYGKANDELLNIFNQFLKNNPFPYLQFNKIVYEKEKKPRTIFSYVCPECGVVIKGKRDLEIICGFCSVRFEFIDPNATQTTGGIDEIIKNVIDEIKDNPDDDNKQEENKENEE